MATAMPRIIPCAHCGARNRIVPGQAGARCGRCHQALAADSGPLAVTDASFKREVLDVRGPVLVDFWAPWCGPCQMLGPTLEKLAERHAGKLKVCKLDTEQNPQVAGNLRVMSIPTLIVFRDGKPAARHSGLMSLEQLEGWLRNAGAI
jgi:thioredoxin 2